MRVFLLFPFLMLSATLVHAEYRVFVLKISKPSEDKTQPAIERTIQSTLDPVQYKDLYPVAPEESIDYIDTWMCKGRTGEYQDYCPKPSSQKAQIPEADVSK